MHCTGRGPELGVSGTVGKAVGGGWQNGLEQVLWVKNIIGGEIRERGGGSQT